MKASKDKVEKNNVELVDGMKNKHADELEKSHEEGWNSATNACANQMRKLKNHIYKSGYEQGLISAGLADNSELFDKTIICPPDVLIWLGLFPVPMMRRMRSMMVPAKRVTVAWVKLIKVLVVSMLWVMVAPQVVMAA